MIVSDIFADWSPGAIRKRVHDHVRVHQRYKRTVWELSQCSDATLSDFGIMRCDIHRLAREHTRWQK
jgi:uncharacterized protein YjiS (DUF1127 family)